MAQRPNHGSRKEQTPNQTLYIKNLPEKLKKEGILYP
jgi:hypothetical protein